MNAFLIELRAQLFGSRSRTIFHERRKMTRALWLKVMFTYGWRCGRCGARSRLEVDHIRALANGGRTEWHNLQILCHSCNRQKWVATADYRQPRRWWQLLLGI